MRVPSVRGIGGKGECVDYSLTLSLHAGQPFALGVAFFCGFIAAFIRT